MFLKPNVEEDNQFIQELNLFNAITEKVVFVFKFH